MKKTSFFGIIGIILLVLYVSGQPYDKSDPKNLPEHDSLFVSSIPEPVDIENILAEYDSLISAEIKASNTVGAAVAIIYNNQVVLQKCFGLRKARTHDSIDENTIFRLASVSKPICGVLAGILADENIICLDDKVTDYIPGLHFKSTSITNELRIKNILSHTSGLVAHSYDDLVEQKIPLCQIMTQLPFANTTSNPGELYSYQNVMFSLYDSIVAYKTGKNYNDVLKDKLFIPFGMNDASTGFEEFKNHQNKALPHSGITPIKMNDRYYNTTPAAGVNASISDMKNFLLTLLSDTFKINNRVEEMIFTPQIETNLSRGYFSQWEKVDSKAYGIGWRIIDYKGRKIAYHGGFVKGYRAEIALCKEENFGIVYLSNSPSAVAARSVPEFINRLFIFKDNQKLAIK
ncbi:MAG: beta-lactamase family protein [Draconibacterium sp.]|nr:beta-lactamase family protein [Draconibacterium sp.]